MEPFGAGSVSVGLHPDPRAPATEQTEQLLAEATVAEQAGFDGITISEHHAGFPGYLPQPLLAANWILGAVPRVWAAPAPLLLSVRSPALVVEELAWTAARFPGRLGAAFAPGYAETDFEVLGVSTKDRAGRFASAVPAVVSSLGGEGPLGADPAVAAGLVPSNRLLLAANSGGAARRAAALGLGMLFPGGEPASRLGAFSATYRAAGGSGPIVGIAVVWLGGGSDVTASLDAGYRAAARSDMRQADGFRQGPFTGDAGGVAAALAAHARAAGLTALNLRFRADDASAAAVVSQLSGAASTLLPELRGQLGRLGSASSTPGGSR